MTIENLKIALSKVLDNQGGANAEWIDQVAQFIMDFFGYEERILDNELTPKDRDVFYTLEGLGLLKTEMEEATIQKGKIWRIHYWILNKEKISKILKKGSKIDNNQDLLKENSIYDNISDRMWDMHK